MLRCQFLCYVLKTLFCIKIALKLSYFCKKMQNFRTLRAPPPDPQIRPSLRIFGYAPANIQGFKRVLDLTCKCKKRTDQTINFFNQLSNLEGVFFQMALKTCEMRFKWHRTTSFYQKLQKHRAAAASFAP